MKKRFRSIVDPLLPPISNVITVPLLKKRPDGLNPFRRVLTMCVENYDFERVRKILRAALVTLSEEPKLFSFRINERTLTQRLSIHLQRFFDDGLSVDCEYNRMWEDDEDLVKKLPWGAEATSTDDDEGRTVYPDIIVHIRGKPLENLLVIEAKRNFDPDTLPIIDGRKLSRFTHPHGDFHYRWGAFLNFVTQGNDRGITVKWFSASHSINKHDKIPLL